MAFKCFEKLGELRDAVDSYLVDNSTTSEIALTYGHPIGTWCVGAITNFEDMFENAEDFNEDISNWNVGNATSMQQMFLNASSFNQNISGWDVSNVVNMTGMFAGAAEFNQDLSFWNVEKLQIAKSMFRNTSKFNSSLNEWNTSNLLNTENMFFEAIAFNQPLNNWNVERVTSMKEMFAKSSMGQSLSTWKPISCKNMSKMFRDTNYYNWDMSRWDVSSVQNFSSMFQNSIFNQDISNWNVSSGTSFFQMFYNARDFSQNLCPWNITSNANVTDMFQGSNCPQKELPDFDLSIVGPLCNECNMTNRIPPSLAPTLAPTLSPTTMLPTVGSTTASPTIGKTPTTLPTFSATTLIPISAGPTPVVSPSFVPSIIATTPKGPAEAPIDKSASPEPTKENAGNPDVFTRQVAISIGVGGLIVAAVVLATFLVYKKRRLPHQPHHQPQQPSGHRVSEVENHEIPIVVSNAELADTLPVATATNAYTSHLRSTETPIPGFLDRTIEAQVIPEPSSLTDPPMRSSLNTATKGDVGPEYKDQVHAVHRYRRNVSAGISLQNAVNHAPEHQETPSAANTDAAVARLPSDCSFALPRYVRDPPAIAVNVKEPPRASTQEEENDEP